MPSRADRMLEEILQALTRAMTCQELADDIGANYHTTLKYLHEAEKEGLVKRLPGLRDKAYVWVKSGAKNKMGKIEWYYHGDWRTPAKLLEIVSQEKRQPANIRAHILGVMSQLAQRSYFAANEWTPYPVPAPADCKRHMVALLEELGELRALVYAIIETPDLWAENKDLYLDMGFNEAWIEMLKEGANKWIENYIT